MANNIVRTLFYIVKGVLSARINNWPRLAKLGNCSRLLVQNTSSDTGSSIIDRTSMIQNAFLDLEEDSENCEL